MDVNERLLYLERRVHSLQRDRMTALDRLRLNFLCGWAIVHSLLHYFVY